MDRVDPIPEIHAIIGQTLTGQVHFVRGLKTIRLSLLRQIIKRCRISELLRKTGCVEKRWKEDTCR